MSFIECNNYCTREILNSLSDNFISFYILPRETKIPEGIALTDGLKENIFMTLVCALSLTPLVIIGPPGSSKVSRT